MERQKIIMPEENDCLAFIGDIHYGHPNVALKQLTKAMKFIDENDMFVVLTGDLIEGREPSHKFYIPGSPTVQEQKKWAIKFFKDVAESGRLVGILSGNHESGIQQKSSLDPVEDICDMLGVKYLHDMAYLNFKNKNKNYKIIAAHGGGGATTVQGTTTKIRNFSRSFPVDGVVLGHTHQLFAFPDTYVEFNNNMDYKAVYRQLAYAGTFLKSYRWEVESYAEKKNYNPTPLGFLWFEMDNGILQPRPQMVP